jgi:AraC family transcriptional regulator, activator of mtrCDE
LDLIERLLATLEVGVGAFACCDIRKGHQLTFESRPAAGVHYCLQGMGVLHLKGRKSVMLRAHSFVILPPNVMYSLGAREEHAGGDVPRRRLRAPLFTESVPTIQAGDGAAGILTACGEVRFDGVGTPGFFLDMQEPMVEHFDGPGLREQFVILLAESARPQFGTRPLTEALLKQCLILLLRRQVERGMPPLSWMAALAEGGLADAMMAILQRYDQPLTVDRLARMAGMSRSAFALRFSQAFSQTPMNLLRCVRLRRAKELLATSKKPVEEIAAIVGFSSRSHFSRAFRLEFGQHPTRFRATSTVNSPKERSA